MTIADQLWEFLARALGSAVGVAMAIVLLALFVRGGRRRRRWLRWRRRHWRDDE